VLIPELSALVDAVVALLLVLASAVPVLGVA
jgi:hypothetical protein